MSSFSSYTLSRRFAVLIGVFALGFAAYGFWSLKTLNELKVNGPVYQRIVQGKDLIAESRRGALAASWFCGGRAGPDVYLSR